MDKYKKLFSDKVYHGTISKHLESLKMGIDITQSNKKQTLGEVFTLRLTMNKLKNLHVTRQEDIITLKMELRVESLIMNAGM